MRIWIFISGWPRTNHSRSERGGTRLRHRIQAYASHGFLAACLSGAFSIASAAENEQSEAAPDLEFLEFLGSFETDAGDWINPASLLSDEFGDLLEASSSTGEENDSTNTDDTTTNDQ